MLLQVLIPPTFTQIWPVLVPLWWYLRIHIVQLDAVTLTRVNPMFGYATVWVPAWNIQAFTSQLGSLSTGKTYTSSIEATDPPDPVITRAFRLVATRLDRQRDLLCAQQAQGQESRAIRECSTLHIQPKLVLAPCGVHRWR